MNEDKKRRHRRSATEIGTFFIQKNKKERHYKCPIETCQKNYGSEGSLA